HQSAKFFLRSRLLALGLTFLGNLGKSGFEATAPPDFDSGGGDEGVLTSSEPQPGRSPPSARTPSAKGRTTSHVNLRDQCIRPPSAVSSSMRGSLRCARRTGTGLSHPCVRRDPPVVMTVNHWTREGCQARPPRLWGATRPIPSTRAAPRIQERRSWWSGFS